MAMAAALALRGGAAAAQQVTLPLAQFEALRQRARTVAEAPPAPPAPFAVESDDLEVVAGPASARIVQVLAIRLLAPDWQAIPVGDPGSLVAADLGGLEGRVTTAAGGSVLQVRGHGEYRVRLESVAAVVRDPAATRQSWRFALRLPAAAVARGVMALAPALAGVAEEVDLGGGGVLQGGGPAPPWRFLAAPGRDLAVQLLGRAVLPERARLPLRFEATAATSAVMSRTRLEVHGRIVARIAQGRLAELRVQLPAGLTVAAVSGAVAGWKVAEGGDLLVTPLAADERILDIGVELTGPPGDAFAAPLLLPRGAVRSTLLTRATLQGDGLLVLADPGATRPPDAQEAAPVAAESSREGGRLYAVVDAARPPRWQAEWADRTEVLAAQIDDLWVDVAAGEAGQAAYQLWAAVRNRGTARLALRMPPGFEVALASRDGVPLAPGMAADQSLIVPLAAHDAPQLVHVTGVMPLALPRGDGALAVPLPTFSAPAARIWMRVVLPGGRTYALADPTRARGATPPPLPGVTAAAYLASKPGDLAGQLLPRAAAGSAVMDTARPGPEPEGFVVLAASWNALSAAPAPLAVQVTIRKEKEPWF
jgi:hypothetical protein